jgi:plasmid replication initiation protein
MGNNKTAQHSNLSRSPLPLSLYERKIFTLLLACLNADMVEYPQVIRISVKELVGTDNPTAIHYELIEKACRALYSRSISLLPLNAPKGNLSLVRIVQAIEHIKGIGYIEAWFATKIIPYLLELKEWQFYLAEQKPANTITERKQPPSVLMLEFLLQLGEFPLAFNEI